MKNRSSRHSPSSEEEKIMKKTGCLLLLLLSYLFSQNTYGDSPTYLDKIFSDLLNGVINSEKHCGGNASYTQGKDGYARQTKTTLERLKLHNKGCVPKAKSQKIKVEIFLLTNNKTNTFKHKSSKKNLQ